MTSYGLTSAGAGKRELDALMDAAANDDDMGRPFTALPAVIRRSAPPSNDTRSHDTSHWRHKPSYT
jgi:hypothetical protein